MSKNEKAVVQQTAVVASDPVTKAVAMREEAQAMAAQMKEYGIDASDVIVPLLMVIQNTSGAVGDGKAKLGDIFHSVDEKVLGGVDKPLEIIPLRGSKSVRIYDVSAGTPKLLRVEPYTGVKVIREGVENGVPIKRFETFNFYVLLKKDADEGTATPFLLRLKSTGMTAGRKISTHFFQKLESRKLPYGESLVLTVRKEKKDQNTFAVASIEKGSVCGEEAILSAEKWLPRLASLQIAEREDDDITDVNSEPTVVPSVVQPQASAQGLY